MYVECESAMKRIAIAFFAWGATIAAMMATLWFGYFGLFWFIGQIFEPGLGLVLVAGPISALSAIALAFYVLTIGIRVATRLDDQFSGVSSSASK